MTTLFDQDYITELYGAERENEGRNEERLNAIRNLMRKLKLSLTESMDFLEIPKEEQNAFIQALSNETPKA